MPNDFEDSHRKNPSGKPTLIFPTHTHHATPLK